MAWTKKVLRVNLTAGTCTTEPLNQQWAQDYLGQRGLATKYLCSEIDPKVDPLVPSRAPWPPRVDATPWSPRAP